MCVKMHNKISKIFTAFFFAVILLGPLSCDNGNDPVTGSSTGPVAGATTPFGNGVATPYIETIKNGPPLNVGVAFKGDIKDGLDSVNNRLTFLKFTPTNNNTVYSHITIRWNPRGQVKSGPFSSAHIAVDFNMISETEQGNIFTGDSSVIYKSPPQEQVPRDYKLLPNSGAANFGALFYDTTSSGVMSGNLTNEITFGFYDGKMVSFEVIFTLDYLKVVSKFVGEIKQPQVYPGPGYYPAKYVISYEPTKNTFYVVLTEFIKH